MRYLGLSTLLFAIATSLLVAVVRSGPGVPASHSTPMVTAGTPSPALMGSRLWTKWASPTAGWVAEVTEVSTLEKYVDITWSRGGGGKRQQYFLPYYPTEVVKGLTPDTVLIAGKMDTGATVIELVQLNVPLLIPHSGAASIVALQPPGRRSYVFNEATVGKDGIVFMHPMLPDKTSFLVQFYDSRDVYVFDSSDYSMTLAASPSAQLGAPLLVPDLSRDFYEIVSATHIQLGAIYRFSGDSVPGLLLLIDSGSDGSLDAHHYYPDYGAYCAAGMQDASNYTDL